jgi:truncated hemoglobin YjbI
VTPSILLTAGALLAFAGGWVGGAVWTRQDARPAPPITTTQPRRVTPMTQTDDTLLFPPPTVLVDDQDVVLWTWMRHHHPRPEGLAQRVVKRFYDAAAHDPEVADYFVGIDLPGLQRHFVRAFIALADRGLTTAAVHDLADRHATVRNTRGEPVSVAVFDRVVAALGASLHAEGVPTDAIRHIVAMCVPIRTAMTAGTA